MLDLRYETLLYIFRCNIKKKTIKMFIDVKRDVNLTADRSYILTILK